jgi:hypothetical protein
VRCSVSLSGQAGFVGADAGNASRYVLMPADQLWPLASQLLFPQSVLIYLDILIVFSRRHG